MAKRAYKDRVNMTVILLPDDRAKLTELRKKLLVERANTSSMYVSAGDVLRESLRFYYDHICKDKE